ncbi:hypothetical protein ACJMK2_014887 [Sinanodonta woodiana]|uniref:Uncharacterized protein n=1 Tax=Sinanodonta woodiana TaxID=1069815 RepID=A0ABD3V1Z7_SINWO
MYVRMYICIYVCMLVSLVLAQQIIDVSETCPNGLQDCILPCWPNQTMRCEYHICTCEALHNTGQACHTKTDCQGASHPDPERCNDHQIHCLNNECHCAHHGSNHGGVGKK